LLRPSQPVNFSQNVLESVIEIFSFMSSLSYSQTFFSPQLILSALCGLACSAFPAPKRSCHLTLSKENRLIHAKTIGPQRNL
jgi:hypothetical protein